MYYLTMVRNIVSNIDNIKHLDNLRKHLAKSKVGHGYYITKEISKDKKQLHIHACISVKTIEDKIEMMKYIEKHHLRNYVDKVREIPTEYEAGYYCKYMDKDLTFESLIYLDYMKRDYEDTIWDNVKTPIRKYINNNSDDDPFIDSDTDELINKLV